MRLYYGTVFISTLMPCPGLSQLKQFVVGCFVVGCFSSQVHQFPTFTCYDSMPWCGMSQVGAIGA